MHGHPFGSASSRVFRQQYGLAGSKRGRVRSAARKSVHLREGDKSPKRVAEALKTYKSHYSPKGCHFASWGIS
jgi:hypothetical protein